MLVVLVCLWCGIPPSDGRASPVQRNQATPELHPESQTTLVLGVSLILQPVGLHGRKIVDLNAEERQRG